ncbi:MAG: molybdate ABC transporter permease subunit [Coriobacteriales bacterium]|nr:molybdate ABC transporter permease subunit [Coriobacteriales bacterium]
MNTCLNTHSRHISFVTAAAAVIVFALALCFFGMSHQSFASTVEDGMQLVEGSAVNDEAGIGINDFKRMNKGTARSYNGTSFGYRFPLNDPEAFAVIATSKEIIVFIPQQYADECEITLDNTAKTNAFFELVAELDAQFSSGGTKISKLDVPITYSIGQDTVTTDIAQYKRDVEIGDGHTYITITRTDGAQDKDDIVCCDTGHLVKTAAVQVEAIPTFLENVQAFFAKIDYRPLWVSLKTSATALVVVFILGLLSAWKSMGVKSRWKGIVDTIFTIPMVLPPTVCGFLLLLLFGNSTPFGSWLLEHGIKLVFSWPATVLAAIVVAFPLMYRTARGAFEALDSNMLDAARTLGWSERRIFYRLMIPLAWPSIAAGTVLAFARAMGEFGATLFCAGNYAGITQTMPIAIYFSWMGGQTDVALFWVGVVILISFIVILVINVYSAHAQRYRKGELTRKERRILKESGGTTTSIDDQSFIEVGKEDIQQFVGNATNTSGGAA